MKHKVYAMLLLFVFAITFASAVPLPHKFTGNIITKDNSNPDGFELIGKINGLATGVSKIEGSFFDIVVEDSLGKGGKVTFTLGDNDSDESFTFVAFGRTDGINLTFDTAKPSSSSCGNKVCGAGECSTCPIDCGILQCKGNNVCDKAIGETCSNAPEDCGTCSTNGGSGGGGGSGGSSNRRSTTTGEGSGSAPGNSSEIPTVDELNEGIKNQQETSQEEPQTFTSLITGAVVGAMGKRGVWMILLLIIILVVLYLYVRNERKKEAAAKAAAAAAAKKASKKKKTTKKKKRVKK